MVEEYKRRKVPFALKLLALVAVAWAALSPPLFTDGACSAEYDAENKRLEAGRPSLASPSAADAWFSERGIPHAMLSVDDCRKRKPRTLSRCGDGQLLVAKVPVKNLVCRIYRDDEIAVMLQYDQRDRLERMESEMHPYKSLPLPGGHTLHWAR
jgi:hypothetical protein